MSRYHVRHEGAPFGGGNLGQHPNLPAALTPHMNRTPVSTVWGGARVHQSLGQWAVPAPPPAGTSFEQSQSKRGSWNSPDVILPDIGHAQINGLPIGQGVRYIESDNPMPIPAVNVRNQPTVAQKPAKMGGLAQVIQPGVNPVWPDLYGRNTGTTGSGPSVFGQGGGLPWQQ